MKKWYAGLLVVLAIAAGCGGGGEEAEPEGEGSVTPAAGTAQAPNLQELAAQAQAGGTPAVPGGTAAAQYQAAASTQARMPSDAKLQELAQQSGMTVEELKARMQGQELEAGAEAVAQQAAEAPAAAAQQAGSQAKAESAQVQAQMGNLSPEAIAAMKEKGVDINELQAQALAQAQAQAEGAATDAAAPVTAAQVAANSVTPVGTAAVAPAQAPSAMKIDSKMVEQFSAEQSQVEESSDSAPVVQPAASAASLPEGFPSSVPIIEGLVIRKSETINAEANGYKVVGIAQKQPNQVLAWYVQQWTAAGWKEDMAMEQGRGIIVGYKKDGLVATVEAAPAPGGSMVTLTTGNE